MDKQEWSVLDIDPDNEILLHGGKWSEEAKRRVSEARRAGRSVLDMFGDLYKKSEKTVSSAAKSASNMVRPTAKAVSKTASNLIRVAKKGVFSQGSKTTTITRVKSITDSQGHKVGPKKGNGRKVGPKTAEAKRRKTDYERGKAMDKRYADEKRRKTNYERGKWADERERRNRVRKSTTDELRGKAMDKRYADEKRRKTDLARGKAMDKRASEERRRKADQDRGKAMDERERRNHDRKRKAAAERKEQKRFYDEKRRKTDYERGKWMDRRELRNRQEGMKNLKDNARSAKNLPEGRVNRSGIGNDFGKAVDQARQKGALKPNKKAYNDRQFEKGKRGEYNDRMNDFQKRKKGLVKRGSLAGSLRQSATFDYQAALTAVSKKKIKMN